MNKITILVSRISRALPLLTLLILLASCNSEEEIHHYFAELGLNRLAVLRTDIQPGSLILVGKQDPVYSAIYVHTFPHQSFSRAILSRSIKR